MIVGCHMSIKDGYLAAAKKANQLGATAYQYFPKNPRSLVVKDFNQLDALLCKEFCQEHGIFSVSHTPYPTSLTPVDSKRKITIESLLNDLLIAEACGSIGVVVHFGNQMDVENPLIAYELMIFMLNEVLRQWEGNSMLLIENVAGKPGTMGTTLEELVQVRNLCAEPEKIGYCFDTCHAFASGIWNGTNYSEFMDKGKSLGFFENLKVIHLNNSKYESGSGKDRHANIQNGKIHLDFISQFILSREFTKVPFVLETPRNHHQEEINLVRQIEQKHN